MRRVRTRRVSNGSGFAFPARLAAAEIVLATRATDCRREGCMSFHNVYPMQYAMHPGGLFVRRRLIRWRLMPWPFVCEPKRFFFFWGEDWEKTPAYGRPRGATGPSANPAGPRTPRLPSGGPPIAPRWPPAPLVSVLICPRRPPSQLGGPNAAMQPTEKAKEESKERTRGPKHRDRLGKTGARDGR